MYIIGITGTLGAGKGTVVEYLVKDKGFRHYSVRGFLREELERRNMPVNRDTLTAIANTLRAKHNPAYIAQQLIKQAKETGQNCIIESIRTPGEIQSLRAYDTFYLLAIDADPRVRYQRIRKRNSETDNISYHVFIDNEQREMHTHDPNKQNLAACIEQADHVIHNNGGISALHQQIESFLEKIGFSNPATR